MHMLAVLLVAAVTGLPIGSYVADATGVVRIAGEVCDAMWLDNNTVLVISEDGELYRCAATGQQKVRLTEAGKYRLHALLGVSPGGGYVAAASTSRSRAGASASDTIHFVNTRTGRVAWRQTRPQTAQLESYGWVVWKHGSEQDAIVCWPPAKILDPERGSIQGFMPAYRLHLATGTSTSLALLRGTLWAPVRWGEAGLAVAAGAGGFTELLVALDGGPVRVLPPLRVQYMSPTGHQLGEWDGKAVVVYLDEARTTFRLTMEDGQGNVLAEQQFAVYQDRFPDFQLNDDGSVTVIAVDDDPAAAPEACLLSVHVSRGMVGDVLSSFRAHGLPDAMNDLIPSPAGDRLFIGLHA
ncbi:MAG: hypothetical protein HUU35_02865 [Armatimonadetes bacterium]|nr:hypothetical protein [Armatimonadota bacterium]